MTRILTVSSGRATPNNERNASATQGFSGAARSEANGARARPSSEMLAAPRRNAVQTLAGGPGRSPVAITSHNISRAGATAAVPMTVGRDSRTFISMANMPFFRVIYRSKRLRPHVAGRCPAFALSYRARSATPADILQPRIHDRVFRADRIDVFGGIDFRNRSPLLCSRG